MKCRSGEMVFEWDRNKPLKFGVGQRAEDGKYVAGFQFEGGQPVLVAGPFDTNAEAVQACEQLVTSVESQLRARNVRSLRLDVHGGEPG